MSFASGPRSKTRPSPVKPPKLPTDSTSSPPPYLSRPKSGSDSESDSDNDTFHDARFPPDEEASLLETSNTTKSEANKLFSLDRYSEAISVYDRALASCPNYLDYEIAVVKSNIAACHLKLEEWKEVVEAANVALEGLDRLDPPPKETKETNNTGVDGSTKKPGATTSKTGAESPGTGDANDAVIELADDEDDTAALEKLALSDARKTDISRIRAKALMRRARARSSLAGWSNLSGAEEDYKRLSSDPHLSAILPPSDMKVVRAGLRDLPLRIAAEKEKEMGEMMGKLKDLGNGILKPFGLSTDNFKMIKDEKTGGYSMNFEQGAKK